MLIREGEYRTNAIDVRLAVFLAAVAGALNAAGFQAVGLFSANMTGNVSSAADFLALGQFWLVGMFGALVVVFVVGALCSGLLIEVGRKRQIRGIYAYSVLLEAALLIVLGAADLLLPAVQSGPPLVLGLSFIMGLQNAATTRISNARVRTTHVSGMATDIGLHVATLITGTPDRKPVVDRLGLHLATLAAFFGGGVIGVLGYLAIGGFLLLAVAGMLLALALPELRRAGATTV